MTPEELLLTRGTLIGVVISAIISAFVQYLFQARLAKASAEVSKELEQVKAELKFQSDRNNSQFQTQFNATHKVREEIAASLLSEFFNLEKLARKFYVEADKSTAHIFDSEYKEAEAKMRYQVSLAEIYFPDETYRQFATIQVLLIFVRHKIWVIYSPISPEDPTIIRGEIDEMLKESIPKQRGKLVESLKAILLPAS